MFADSVGLHTADSSISGDLIFYVAAFQESGVHRMHLDGIHVTSRGLGFDIPAPLVQRLGYNQNILPSEETACAFFVQAYIGRPADR